MKLITRAGWGARSRTTSTNITPSRGGVTIHYVGASSINDSHSQCAARVRGIQNHHINGNGWSDIAYSLLVCRHGYVYVGRGINRRTAANGTNAGNQNWYAVCALLGGSQKPTDEMVQGIKDAVAYLRKSGGAGPRVNGHRDHLATSCPGGPLYQMVRDGVFGSGGSAAPSPGSGGGTTTNSGDEEMLGLKEGDKGEAVKALQTSLRHAGFGHLLGNYGPNKDGVDGVYGKGVSKAVLACRRWVGSSATSGTSVTGSAAAQIRRAVARREAEDAVKDLKK